MIPSRRIHEEYKRHLNRINSGFDQRVGIIDGDGFINEGIDIVFENLATKFEINTFARNNLRQLEVKKVKLKAKKFDKISSIVDYPEDLYMLTREFLQVCRKNCPKERLIDVFIIQSSDLTPALKDPNWAPSFEWEQALAEDSGNNLILYHNCDFDIKEIEIDYLRKPKHIATPSMLTTGATYISGGKTISNDINFEIDSTYVWRKVVQVAVLITLAALGDIQDYDIQLKNILSLDKVFIN